MDCDKGAFPINKRSEQKYGFSNLGNMLPVITIKELQLKPRKLKNTMSLKNYRYLNRNKKPLSFWD